MPNCGLFTRCGGATVVGHQPFSYAAAPSSRSAPATAAVSLLGLPPVFAEAWQAPELRPKEASEAYFGAVAYSGAFDQELVGRWAPRVVIEAPR